MEKSFFSVSSSEESFSEALLLRLEQYTYCNDLFNYHHAEYWHLSLVDI